MTERDWTGKAAPTIVKRSSPLCRRFENEDWIIEVTPRRIADVTLSWAGIGTNKKTGQTREFGPYRTWPEVTNFLEAFKGLREIKPGEREADAQRKQDLQRMIHAKELPTGLQGEALSFGLSLEPAAEPTVASTSDGPFTQTDHAVFDAWCHREPQNEFFLISVDEKDPHHHGHVERKTHNFHAISDYLLQHEELRPVTIEILDAAYQVLLSMDCIHKTHTFHRGFGTLIGGRARDYSSDRDPSFKRQRTFTEDELAAARRKLVFSGLPQGTTITVEKAAEVLGDEALAEALFTEATRK